jgi:hypothetical protein
MDKGNVLAKDGKSGDTLQSILEDLRPEAAYFADIEGARGGYLVVHMDDASQIPAFAEPLFLGLGATLHAQPVFTPEDMPRAMEALEAVRRPNPQPSRHRPAKYRLLTETLDCSSAML